MIADRLLSVAVMGLLMLPLEALSPVAPPLRCSACSILEESDQTVIGDRSIAPYKVYAIFLKVGSRVDVVASGGLEAVGQFDLSLYGPQQQEFDFDHATCLARAFAGGISSKAAEVPGQPTIDSGCRPNTTAAVDRSSAKKPPKDAHPAVVNVTGSKAHIQYSAPVEGWYFIALQFSGSGIKVVLEYKES